MGNQLAWVLLACSVLTQCIRLQCMCISSGKTLDKYGQGSDLPRLLLKSCPCLLFWTLWMEKGELRLHVCAIRLKDESWTHPVQGGAMQLCVPDGFLLLLWAVPGTLAWDSKHIAGYRTGVVRQAAVVGTDVILAKAQGALFLCLSMIRELFRIVLQHLSRYKYIYMYIETFHLFHPF